MAHPIGHVNNIPTIQFFTGISRNTKSKLYMLSLNGISKIMYCRILINIPFYYEEGKIFVFQQNVGYFLGKHTCAKQASLCDLLTPDFGHTKEWSAAPTVAVNLTPET